MLVTMLALLFLLMTAAVKPQPAYGLPCMYSSRHEGMIELQGCAARHGEQLRVRPFVLTHSTFDRHGLTQIHCDGSWWYVRHNGATQRMATMDNGADYFNAGLARAISHGKTGFVDHQLRFVIPARYDNAMPFSGETADVCDDCVEKREDEHSILSGGRWGKVDRMGHEVVSLPASSSAAPGPR